MRTLPRIKLLAFAFALVGVGFTAPAADAGTRDKTVCRSSSHYNVEFNSGQHYDSHRNTTRSHSRHHSDGFNFSIRVGSSDRHYDRGYRTSRCDTGYSTRHYNRRQVVYRSDRHYDHGHRDHYDTPRVRTVTRSFCDVRPTRTVVITNHHHHQRGYWKRVYVPAVYETRYYSCGTPYRVCVRAAYYKRVWVSGSTCH